MNDMKKGGGNMEKVIDITDRVPTYEKSDAKANNFKFIFINYLISFHHVNASLFPNTL